ncbi:MAG: Holliday junction resolvase RuvX [Eubacteriales bacterium]|nr:Holliday junction resolvase RuvX [Eubacteriales bacterium]
MRIMALDVGDKKIGVALSDPLKITSQGLETYIRKDTEEDFKYFAELIKNNNVEILVAGLPKNMNGSEGPQADKVKEFIKKLQKYTDVKVDYSDERLTTMEAEKMLISGDVSRKNRKKVIDKVAANLILQNYLQRHY